MYYKDLLEGLKDWNASGQYAPKGTIWLQWEDLKEFLRRCRDNRIPVYEIEVFRLEKEQNWYWDTLLPDDRTLEEEDYLKWMEHLLDELSSHQKEYIEKFKGQIYFSPIGKWDVE